MGTGAKQTLVGGLTWPEYGGPETGTGSNYAMTATGHKVAYLCVMPKAGTLDKVHFLLGNTVTTGDTVRVSFQSNDPATGLPDGTQDQYRDVTVADGDDGTIWKSTGLVTSDGTDGGVKRTVTQGELVWIVLEFPSYVAGSFNIFYAAAPASPFGGAYVARYDGSSWTKAQGIGICDLEYNDATLAATPTLAAGYFGSNAPASNTTPDEYANKFVMAFDCDVSGAYIYLDCDGDCDVILYSSADAVLASASFDSDTRQGTGALHRVFVQFDTTVSLTAGTAYRLAIKPTTTTAVTIARARGLRGASSMARLPGGSDIVMSTRTDAGAWTDSTTERLFASLVITAVYDSPPDPATVAADVWTNSGSLTA